MRIRISFIFVTLSAALITAEAADSQLPVEFRLGSSESGGGLVEYQVPGSDDLVYLHDEVLLSNCHIDSVSVVEGWNGYHILLTFTDEGDQLLSEITDGNVGEYLAIIVDGDLLIAAVIQEEVSGPARITGEYTEEEATRLAEGIMGLLTDPVSNPMY